MLYNPITNQLFSDSGAFIKQLHCPLQVDWDKLGQTIPLKGKICDRCDKLVVDSNLINESDLMAILKQDPHTCIKIDFNQENIYLTHKTHEL